MLLLLVWIAVVVLAAVVLGALLFGLLGAARRLFRELAALDGEVRPLIEAARTTAARAANTPRSS